MKKYTKFALFLIGSLFVCENSFSCISLIQSARNLPKFSTVVLRTYIAHRNFSIVRVADPTYDSSFKALFGNEPILKAFLSDMIPHVLVDMNGDPYTVQKISDIATDHSDVKNNCSNESDDNNKLIHGPDIVRNQSPFKKIIFDVFCKCHVKNVKTNKSLVVDIEMQRETGYYFLDRMDYYAARKLAEQVPNATYTDINPVLVIAIAKTYFPNYKKSGAVFLSTNPVTLPLLGIDSETEPKKRQAMSNVICIQLDNMYEMLTNKKEFEEVKKLFPRTTILFDVLNIERFAKKKKSFSFIDGSVAPESVDKGIYAIDQNELPNSDIKENVIEKLKECAENKKFPEEVSDTEKFWGLVGSKFTEGFAEGEKIGIEKGKAEGKAEGEKIGIEKGKAEGKAEGEKIAQLQFIEILLKTPDDPALLTVAKNFGYNNVQEAKSFWDQNKYLLEAQSETDTAL